MRTIKVGKGTSYDFNNINEAINSTEYDVPVKLLIAEGVYEEKIFCEKKQIELVGEGTDKTIIKWHDGAYELLEDGEKRGTFRSYTAFLSAEKLVVKNLSFVNEAGDGRVSGQSVALYSDADVAYFENVCFDSHQDTLFLSPLPETERQKNGFVGPRENSPRKLTKQYYNNCKIIGDIDFIFGGADAVFENCDIEVRDREHELPEELSGFKPGEQFINGYVAAPCGNKNNLGFVFKDCYIHGAPGCRNGSVFLARPWRDEAKAAYLNCKTDECIHPKVFSGWKSIDAKVDETFIWMNEKGNDLVSRSREYERGDDLVNGDSEYKKNTDLVSVSREYERGDDLVNGSREYERGDDLVNGSREYERGNDLVTGDCADVKFETNISVSKRVDISFADYNIADSEFRKLLQKSQDLISYVVNKK